MKQIFILIAVVGTLAVSCRQNSGNKTKKHEKKTVAQMAKTIKLAEDTLFNSQTSSIDIQKAKALINQYIEFADAFPADSMAPNFLFKASDISMNLNQATQTIFIFNRIINQYPNYKNTPTCYFLKAFVYDDQLKDYKNAKKYYNIFLKTFPKHKFTNDARMALKNLGKSPEELIKEFEKKNKKKKAK